MADEALHGTIETYIHSNMTGSGVKFSLNVRDPRDYTIEGAPLLMDGTEQFMIFDVSIERGTAASIGNTTKRRIGTVRVEMYLLKEQTKREMYKLADIVTAFLERKTDNGVIYRDVVWTGDAELGKWHMETLVIDFQRTVIN